MLKKNIIALLALSMLGSTAHAMEADYYYDGMKSANKKLGYSYASKISNDKLVFKPYVKNKTSPFNAVGYVKNMNGWAGKDVEVMGTGFVVDDYTILTNAHVIDDEFGKKTGAKYLRFDLAREGDVYKHRFQIKNVIKIPYADIAVLHTKVKLTNYVKPLKLATEAQIYSLKYGQPLYSVSYPYHGDDYDYSKRYYNMAMFLRRTNNDTEITLKDKFRAGASGSPLVDSKYRVYGLRTYGYNLYDEKLTKYARVELTGVESLTGYTRQQVIKYLY